MARADREVVHTLHVERVAAVYGHDRVLAGRGVARCTDGALQPGEALLAVTDTLSEHVGPGLQLGRYGPDEFLLIATPAAVARMRELVDDVRHTARMKRLWACRCGRQGCTGTMLKPKKKR